jgi:hypothetical protein
MDNHFDAPSDWSWISVHGLPAGSGVLFEEMELDPRIGPEVVAILIDPEPGTVFRGGERKLHLHSGIASTRCGPVLFLIWWIPPLVQGRPTAFYEQIMNPLSLGTAQILNKLASQSHLHLLLVDQQGRFADLIEFRNIFPFNEILGASRGSRATWLQPYDFKIAKQAYMREHTIDDLFAARRDN